MSSSDEKIVDFGKEKWDYLIILDACRYDFFDELNTIDGVLEKRLSCDSDTINWMIKTWGCGRRFTDVVYISANPIVSNYICRKSIGYIPFYKIVEVFDFGWNEYLKTVPPDIVTRVALTWIKSSKTKRFVIHYIQPHHPYITRPDLDEIGFQPVLAEVTGRVAMRGKTAYELAREGVISREELINTYKENLRIVLSEVEKLVEKLDGRIIISADHGEALGENGVFGHPAGCDLPCLREIPFLIVEK